MTDRDTFAAAAMTGLLANPTLSGDGMEKPAQLFYAWADAMLRERALRSGDAAYTDGVSASDESKNNDVDNRGPAVVAFGNVIGGFEFHGPFPTISAAHEWYKQSFFGGVLKMPCSIVLLVAPRPATTTDRDAAPAATAPIDAMPLPAAPVTHGEGTGDTHDDGPGTVEAVAEVVYEAMRFDRSRLHCRPAPPWAAGGNSLAQQEARDAARQILSIVQPPAGSVRLTDEERRELEAAASEYERGAEKIVYGSHVYERRAATIRGLLARATKEGGR
jgi:hypothetical protein